MCDLELEDLYRPWLGISTTKDWQSYAKASTLLDSGFGYRAV